MKEESIIELKDTCIVQHDHVVLDDVNFKLNKGELVYLIGKTGSGKSSFLKTLYGELPLITGEGTVADMDLSKLKRRKIPHLRRKMGIVFQDFQLLPDRSVADNLRFVMRATGWKEKSKITSQIDMVLEMVGLQDKALKFPHQLSGGEQQRVAIARALVNNPEVIIADEPTGNLDPETSDEILQLLFQISKSERGVLIATHNHEMIKKHPAPVYKCENNKFTKLN